jgi:hypothetical protein
MFTPNANYRRFLERENARARMGAKADFEPDDDRDEGEPVYTEEELLELEERANYDDLMRERSTRP